jgi:hypothetical protein
MSLIYSSNFNNGSLNGLVDINANSITSDEISTTDLSSNLISTSELYVNGNNIYLDVLSNKQKLTKIEYDASSNTTSIDSILSVSGNAIFDGSLNIQTINNLRQINGSLLDDITITSENNLILDVTTEANNNFICNNNFFSNSSAYFLGTTNLRNTSVTNNSYLEFNANPIENVKMSISYDPATIGYNFAMYGADAPGRYMRWIVKGPANNDVIGLQFNYGSMYTAIPFIIENDMRIYGGRIKFGDGDAEIYYIPDPSADNGLRIDNIRNGCYTNIRNRDSLGNDYFVFRTRYDKIISEVEHQFNSNILVNSLSISPVELSYLDGVSSNIQTQLNSKAPSASPTFTGTSVFYDISCNNNLNANSIKINGNNIVQSISNVDGSPYNNINSSAWLSASQITSVYDTLGNAPFGNGYYNLINVRHRGGLSDGNLYGLQIVSGLVSNRNRMAFRGQSGANWDAWTEIACLNKDTSFNNMTLNGTLNISSAFGADNANSQLSIVNTTNSKGFKFSSNTTDNLYSPFVSPGDSVISTNQYNNSSLVITTNTSENHGIKLTSASGLSNIKIENDGNIVNLSNTAISLTCAGSNKINLNSSVSCLSDLTMTNKITLNGSSVSANKIETTNIIALDVSGNPNLFKYSNFSYNSNSALGTNQPCCSFIDNYNGNSLYFLPNASVGSYNLLVQNGDRVIVSSKVGERDNNAVCLVADATQRCGVRVSATSSSNTKVEMYASATKNIILDSTSGVSMTGLSTLTFNDTTIQSTAYTSTLNTKLNAIGTISTASLTANTTLTTGTTSNISSSGLSLSAGTYILNYTTTFHVMNGSTAINNYSTGYSINGTSHAGLITRGCFLGQTAPLDSYFCLSGSTTLVFGSTTSIYLLATAVFNTANRLEIIGNMSQLQAIRIA